MAEIDRRVWLTFDVIGLACIVLGTMFYFRLFLRIGDLPSLIIFAIGVIFVISGAVFGHFELVGIRREFETFARESNVRTAAASVPDDSEEPYVIDLSAAWDAPLEKEYDLDAIMDDGRGGEPLV